MEKESKFRKAKSGKPIKKKSSWFESSFDDEVECLGVISTQKSSNKRKFIHSTSADVTNGFAVPSTSRSQSLKRIKQTVNPNESWVSCCAPICRSELAVHPKKIDELVHWIDSHIGKPSLLLVTGPAGAGKTAALQVICRENDYELLEWINNDKFEVKIEEDEYEELIEHVVPVSQNKQFAQFLHQADHGILRGSDGPKRKKIILVEDFPNAFYRYPKSLHNNLHSYKMHGRHPIVFVVSEASSTSDLSAFHLFPPDVIEQFEMDTINFNKVADSFIKKALERIIKDKMPIIITSPNYKRFLAGFVQKSQGDIRSAINELQLTLPIQKCPKELDVIGLGDKDTNISLFHAIGKLLYAKRITSPPLIDNLPVELRRQNALESDIDEVLTKSSMDPIKFGLFLQENYPDFMPDIEHVADIASDFSFTDCLLSKWESHEIAKENYVGTLTASTLTFNNYDTTTGKPFARRFKGLHKFRGQRTLEVLRESERKSVITLATFSDCRLTHSPRVLLTEILPFVPKIRSLPHSSHQHKALVDLTSFPKWRVQRSSTSLLSNPSDILVKRKDEQSGIGKDEEIYANDVDIGQFD